MAQRTDSYLTTEANIIQNETATGANTALRVGTMLNDVIDSKVNNDRVDDNVNLGGATPSPTLVPSQNAVKTYVDTVLVGYLNDRGNYDPTITSGYPTTGGSGSGGIIEKGDLFFISADGNITSGDTVPVTTAVYTGYTVRALSTTPGQLYANWSISNVGIGYIPENSQNKSTDNTMGGGTPSNVLFSTQKAVKEYVDNEIATAVPYTAENVANKIQDLTINPTSTVQYPSSKAVTDLVSSLSGWSLTGNAGTDPLTNFIGTTDNKSLIFQVNNSEILALDPAGYIQASANIFSQVYSGTSISAIAGAGNSAAIIADNSNGGQVYIQKGSGQSSTLKGSNLTGNRTLELPNANGTIAISVNGTTPDSAGNITLPLSSGWGLTGNSGTTPGTNFIGTTDNQSFIIKTNNTTRVTVNGSNGNLVSSKSIFAINGLGSMISATDDVSTEASLINDPQGSGGQLYLKKALNQTSTLKGSNLTGNRTHELPDADGTFALQSQIVDYVSKVVLTSSDIMNFNTTPIIAVPAPPAGKVICVKTISVKTTAGNGYMASNDIRLIPLGYSTSGGICQTVSQPLSLGNLVASENVQMNWWSGTGGNPSSVALQFAASSGVNPYGGTLGATVYISYILMDL